MNLVPVTMLGPGTGHGFGETSFLAGRHNRQSPIYTADAASLVPAYSAEEMTAPGATSASAGSVKTEPEADVNCLRPLNSLHSRPSQLMKAEEAASAAHAFTSPGPTASTDMVVMMGDLRDWATPVSSPSDDGGQGRRHQPSGLHYFNQPTTTRHVGLPTSSGCLTRSILPIVSSSPTTSTTACANHSVCSTIGLKPLPYLMEPGGSTDLSADGDGQHDLSSPVSTGLLFELTGQRTVTLPGFPVGHLELSNRMCSQV
ncbi:unnamed protein product [Protopolystoma xenopodis]|uniref:Uncharacterized protein n=1 Tax=Protopolystoma xenopodis TaxID=117903 RepID=A0A3S5AGZ8_9PLAT|nr:unnamed protein product [Protopolystoma xenopodis]